jgi:diguanylate cyclase (GGDEF)-like protein
MMTKKASRDAAELGGRQAAGLPLVAIDAVPLPLAILDRSGGGVACNGAWRHFFALKGFRRGAGLAELAGCGPCPGSGGCAFPAPDPFHPDVAGAGYSTFHCPSRGSFNATFRPVEDRFLVVSIVHRQAIDGLGTEPDAWFDELVHHDAVTGLYNRVRFRTALDEAIECAQATGTTGTVLLVGVECVSGLDHDANRHAGDAVLREVADRLSGLAGEGGIVARLADDQFGLILPDLCQEELVATFAERVIDRLEKTPITTEVGTVIDVSADVACCRYPDDGRHGIDLLRAVELAMAEGLTQRRPGHRHHAFTAAMREQAELVAQLNSDLRSAIDNGELEVHYQPKMDVRTGVISGMEALARWRHPDRSMISPGVFIPIAERSGQIAAISEWLTHEACRQTRRWKDEGLADLRVAVNISTTQFVRHSVIGTITAALERTGLDPDNLEVEITESVLAQQSEHIDATFDWLRSVGISVAIDDFGTGYSSLSYLRRFAVDKLKIDYSFVRDLHRDPGDATIVRAILRLGHSLGIKVVGEGVELPPQLVFLANEGCDEAQGYLIGRPMPAQDFEAFLRNPPRFTMQGERVS